MRIGIDIGGTKAHAIAIDDTRTLLGQVVLPSGYGEAEVLTNARSAVAELSFAVAGPIESIGIGIPGNVDAERGIVSHAVNLGIEELALAEGLFDLADGGVYVDNDVNAAALGAFSVLDDVPSSMAYLNVGTGIAAGLVLGGTVWRGFRGIAGEVGHFPVNPEGAQCPCGQRGCLETVASGVAIAAQWRSKQPWPDAIGLLDPEALALRDRVASGVADAVQLLVLTVGVERVSLGGGVIANTPGLVESVRAALAGRAGASRFLASIGLPNRIATAPLDATIPAIGAALLGAATLDRAALPHGTRG